MEFVYTAINRDGAQEQDKINAASYHDAINYLHQHSLIPVEIKSKGEGIKAIKIPGFGGVGLQDKILFIQNVSIMLRAGISLSKSLKILAKQTKNSKLQQVLEVVHSDVESGKSFAEALARHPDVFTNIFVSMVRVGEISGNLDKSLEYLGIQLLREHNLVSKTRGAMIYPAVIVFAIVVVALLLAIFVLPSLVSIFKDSGVTLPLSTRIVIAGVDLISKHTLMVIGALIGFAVLAVASFRSEIGQKLFDKAILKMPVIGEIVKKINMARFSRIMSSMLKSGTPILEGLRVASSSLGNREYREAIEKTEQDVKLGKSLAGSMEKEPKLFSYLVTQMIGVGEESGDVASILETLALRYEEEVDDTMRDLSSVIEPILILVIGSAVGFLALSLISPIYSLTSQAGGGS